MSQSPTKSRSNETGKTEPNSARRIALLEIQISGKVGPKTNPSVPQQSVIEEESARQEARNTLFSPSQEEFGTVLLQGVRNISDAL